MKLENKAVVVTGASSGMGKAIVELFVKEGASVVAVARRKERLEELAESLKEEAGKVEIFPGDISLEETNEAMIDLAVSRFGRLDVLVNNAGVMDDMSPIGDVTNDRFDHVMKVKACVCPPKNVLTPVFRSCTSLYFHDGGPKVGMSCSKRS